MSPDEAAAVAEVARGMAEHGLAFFGAVSLVGVAYYSFRTLEKIVWRVDTADYVLTNIRQDTKFIKHQVDLIGMSQARKYEGLKALAQFMKDNDFSDMSVTAICDHLSVGFEDIAVKPYEPLK